MANVNELTPLILKWEGGFVNDPDDLGGATNMGITIGTYRDYRKKKGLPEPTVDDLKKLSQEEWTEIMKTSYWDRWKADEIKNQSIANILVDWVWTSGVYGIKIPQEILKVTADGLVGPSTLAAINSYVTQAELFEKIKQARYDYIERICEKRPANKKFRNGWRNRIQDFKYVE